MRVVVLGAGGMLGTAMQVGLRRAGFVVDAFDRQRFDVLTANPADLPIIGAAAVVNAAGLINRRLATDPAEAFWLANGLFPRRLADRCQAVGVPMLHISTDCVFDGATGCYDETSPPTATDLYGRSKQFGEPANAMVIRTSIIGPERRHFYSLLCWFLSVETACRGYRNHLWNGMTTVELARVVGGLIATHTVRPGLFHLHSEDVSKLDLLRLMADAFGHRVAIEDAEDTVAKDTRLRTRHRDLLAWAAIQPLAAQLADVARLADRRGGWLDVPELA
jgi:dTDP-4-dehydrorhamnose reductase